ncbi:MAG: hypothetical protein GY873_38655 [Bosea sp.]|uniref:hypothetical protein n=1 Tax=Bosea sp. (in: a-proteobacteria) TaxID=1871050 RepID=UPI0023936B76|nr:hypothetical protein [Bosea sp. (in: a-proteobacteria)]MCP4740126.1 hypothetical protein [Bosea sp. (in: a-proteobacteria)]
MWALQRRYFEETGVEAWRANIVPSYVTTNPYIAGAYAAMLQEFIGDGYAGPSAVLPTHVIELGAGSGRFALSILTRLFADMPTAAPVCYVMTDISQANIDFWRGHPAFARFIANGTLDFARFDAERDSELQLQISGRTIAPDRRCGRLAVIANYVFDGTTQDLFQVEAGRLQELLVRNAGGDDVHGAAPAEHIAALRFAYRAVSCRRGRYAEASWNALLARYARELAQGAFLFPSGALGCLSRLHALVAGPFVVLSCDHGKTRLSDYEGQAPPQPLRHGSFSFAVNYDVLASWACAAGGLALLPEHGHASIAVVGLGFGFDAAAARSLARAYRREVGRFGPDDFFMLKQACEDNYDRMSLRQLIALLRLSDWDVAIFRGCYERLVGCLEDANSGERRNLADGLQALWEHYLDLGEEDDLAFSIGSLLAGLKRPREAIPFFEASLQRDGDHPATRKNLAICRRAMAKGEA